MNSKRKPAGSPQEHFRSRVKEFIPQHRTDLLLDHPENWRVHPDAQKQILETMMARTGKIDAILCYDSKIYGGRVIIDGHQRRTMDDTFPVLVLDVNDQEAREILLTYNPLAAMAEVDAEQIRSVASQLEGLQAAERQAVNSILQTVLNDREVEESEATAPDGGTKFETITTTSPPRMAWTVIGVPIAEFGRVAHLVEALKSVPSAIVETCASDFRAEEVKPDAT